MVSARILFLFKKLRAMKKILFLIATLFLTCALSAQVEFDDLYYRPSKDKNIVENNIRPELKADTLILDVDTIEVIDVKGELLTAYHESQRNNFYFDDYYSNLIFSDYSFWFRYHILHYPPYYSWYYDWHFNSPYYFNWYYPYYDFPYYSWYYPTYIWRTTLIQYNRNYMRRSSPSTLTQNDYQIRRSQSFSSGNQTRSRSSYQETRRAYTPTYNHPRMSTKPSYNNTNPNRSSTQYRNTQAHSRSSSSTQVRNSGSGYSSPNRSSNSSYNGNLNRGSSSSSPQYSSPSRNSGNSYNAGSNRSSGSSYSGGSNRSSSGSGHSGSGRR